MHITGALCAIIISFAVVLDARADDSREPSLRELSLTPPTPGSSSGVSSAQSPLLSERRGFLLSLIPTLSGALLPPLYWGIVLSGGALVPDATLVISVIILSTGVTLGPSLGHFYAKRTRYGLVATGSRLLGYGAAFGLFMLGAVYVMPDSEDDGTHSGPGAALSFTGAGILTAGMLTWGIYDIVTVKRAVRKENERRRKISAVILPCLVLSAKRQPVPSLAIVGRF